MNKSLLIVAILTATVSIYTVQAGESEAVKKLEKELLTRYKHCKELCGAAVHASPHRRHNSMAEQIGCMISGFKDVCWATTLSSEKASETFKSLLEKHKIDHLVFQTGDPKKNELIFHTPAGKTKALLLQRYLTSVDLYVGLKTQKMKNNLHDIESEIEQCVKKNSAIEKEISIIAPLALTLQKPIEQFTNADRKLFKNIGNRLPTLQQKKDMIDQKLEKIATKQKQEKKKYNETKQRLKPTIPNDYLIGFLLGYDPKDIAYYYEKNPGDWSNAKRDPHALAIDRKSAEEWISQQSQKATAHQETETATVWYV